MTHPKYWDIWTWLMLACTILNIYFFLGSFSILSLLFGAFCGWGFWQNVKK